MNVEPQTRSVVPAMPGDLREQARIHLQALHAAGVGRVRKASSRPVPTTMAEPPRLEQSTIAELEAAVPIESRRRELQLLNERVQHCVRCTALCSTRTQTVFGVGQVGAEVCFIGEAPGADEDRLGEPFVGAAGQLLDKILAASGFDRKSVYICNILKCRPPNNRTPLPDESANCKEFLIEQLRLVNPKFLVCLGGTAAQNLLQTTQPIGKLRGRFHEYQGIPVMVTYHPAYLLPHRSPGSKREVWDDMKMLLHKMGKPIPQKKADA